jgi:FkbM family methyltransferase
MLVPRSAADAGGGEEAWREVPMKPVVAPRAGGCERPIGQWVSFLEDVRERGFRPQGVLDIGANRGDWTRVTRTIWPEAEFLLVEPQPEMREPLERLCREHDGISYVLAGAGSTPGERIQTIWEDLAGSSFLPPPDPNLLASGRQRSAPIVTVDSLLRGRSGFRPDLVKLDVQGYELEVLRGAADCFGVTELFIIETSLYSFLPGNPLTRDVIAFMADVGYELYDITEYYRRPSDGALGQIDLALARRCGRLREHNRW